MKQVKLFYAKPTVILTALRIYFLFLYSLFAHVFDLAMFVVRYYLLLGDSDSSARLLRF